MTVCARQSRQRIRTLWVHGCRMSDALDIHSLPDMRPATTDRRFTSGPQAVLFTVKGALNLVHVVETDTSSCIPHSRYGSRRWPKVSQTGAAASALSQMVNW